MKLLTMKLPSVYCYLLLHSWNQHTYNEVGKQTVYFHSGINFFCTWKLEFIFLQLQVC